VTCHGSVIEPAPFSLEADAMTRRRVPPLRTLPIARLLEGQVHCLIGTHVEPPYQARQELAALWDSLSQHGRKAVLTAARLTAREEGTLPEGQPVIAQDAEVS
jgi:DNA-binding transcriptional regulator YdaS (Cro superfamily)